MRISDWSSDVCSSDLHYFSGKEALFIEVMERAYRAMRERQNELALSGQDPIADMRALVVQTVQHFIDQPEFIQLLSNENLYKARHIKKSGKITEMFNLLKTALDRKSTRVNSSH